MPNCSESLGSGRAARCDAQFVMASLVSSGTTRGEPPFVPRSASIAPDLAGRDCNWLGWLQIALDQAPENRARAL